ncbi:MAG TPA: hypothetical protein VF157_06580, partial [Chloroflexota bacterium]
FLVLLVAACGGSPPVPSASPAPSPVNLTNADENKTLQLRVGQVLDVALKADDGMDNWQLDNPDPAVLAPTVNPAAAAAKGVTLRAFKAVAAGTAAIAATERPTCNPGEACSHLIRAFKATVVVTA